MKLTYLAAIFMMSVECAVAGGTLTCDTVVPDTTPYMVRSTYMYLYDIDIAFSVLCVGGGATAATMVADAGFWYFRDSTVDGRSTFRVTSEHSEKCAIYGDYRPALIAYGTGTSKRTRGWEATFVGDSILSGNYLLLNVLSNGVTHMTESVRHVPKTISRTYSVKIADATMTMEAGSSESKKLTVETSVENWYEGIPNVKYKIRPAEDAAPDLTFEEGDEQTLPAPDAPTIQVHVPMNLGGGIYKRILDATITCP
jgi:hypothetical protein